MDLENKIISLLSDLSAFNKLDDHIVATISRIFEINAKDLCKKYGITYFVR